VPYQNPAAGTARQPKKQFPAGTAPTAGTSAVQTITTTGTPTGGTFTLKFRGFETSALAFNESAANIQTALRALASIGSGGVTTSGGPLPTGVVVTFAGIHAQELVPLITLGQNNLTGGSSPTVAIANTTPGVDATLRTAPQDVILGDSSGIVWVNTAATPPATWVKVGTQT